MTYSRKKRTQRGFTLIETLFAVLILAVAIVGPISIAAKGLQLARANKDHIRADFLAQDAIEYVRFIRDTNRLNSVEWLAGLDGTDNGHTKNFTGGQAVCTGGNYCTIDSMQDQATLCGVSLAACSTKYIYYNSANGWFDYDTTAGNNRTVFTRSITVTTPSSGGNASEADVTAVVQWKDTAGIVHSVTLQDNLLNWE